MQLYQDYTQLIFNEIVCESSCVQVYVIAARQRGGERNVFSRVCLPFCMAVHWGGPHVTTT